MTNRSKNTPAPAPSSRALISLYHCVLIAVAWAVVGGCESSGVSDDGGPPGIGKYVEGIREYHAGDLAGARARFSEAVEINPSLRMPHIYLADMDRRDGDYNGAVAQYEILTHLDPYSAANAYHLGLSYQLLRRLQQAAAAYLRALNLEPGNVQANMNLGLVYLALNQSKDALTYLQRATQLDPNSAEAWSNYGVGLDAAGRLVDAEYAYQHALELNSESASTLENLSANLIAQGKAHEALAVSQQLVVKSDSAISRTRYGEALALTGQTDAAMEQYKVALQRDPAFYLAMTDEGFLLIDEYRAGMELDEPKRASAQALWAASLRINPGQPRTLAAVQQWQSAHLFGK